MALNSFINQRSKANERIIINAAIGKRVLFFKENRIHGNIFSLPFFAFPQYILVYHSPVIGICGRC